MESGSDAILSSDAVQSWNAGPSSHFEASFGGLEVRSKLRYITIDRLTEAGVCVYHLSLSV